MYFIIIIIIISQYVLVGLEPTIFRLVSGHPTTRT